MSWVDVVVGLKGKDGGGGEGKQDQNCHAAPPHPWQEWPQGKGGPRLYKESICPDIQQIIVSVHPIIGNPIMVRGVIGTWKYHVAAAG